MSMAMSINTFGLYILANAFVAGVIVAAILR